MDHALLDALAETTRPNVLELSRRLGVARNTVQARLDRLQANGTIAGYAPTVRLASLGYGVLAVPGITRTTTTLALSSPISRVEIAALAVADLLGEPTR